MESIWRDLSFATRLIRRAPGFFVVAVVTLALGIGVNLAMFSVVRSLLLRALPYRNPENLVLFWQSSTTVDNPYFPMTEGGFNDWKERVQVLQGMAGFRLRTIDNGRPMAMTGTGTAVKINGVTASANLFDVLGVGPRLGRGFMPDEDTPGHAKVVILSDGFWRGRFGADTAVLGRTILLDGEAYEMIGVMPPGFFFPPPILQINSVRESAGDVFVPYYIRPDNRRVPTIRCVARLAADQTIESATERLKETGNAVLRDHPQLGLIDLGAVLLPLHGQSVILVRRTLLLLFAATALVFLIACINIAGLLVAMGIERRKEVAMRAALGAAPSRLFRQLLVESVGLALVGGALGLGVAWAALWVFSNTLQSQLPRLGPIEIDSMALLFAVTLALLSGLAFGCVPAVRSSRGSLQTALRAGGRGGLAGGHRFRRLLVAGEVAMASVLLIFAGLLFKSLMRMQSVDVGFKPEGVLTIQAILPEVRYPDVPAVEAFYERMRDLFRSMSDVESVGIVSLLPMSGSVFGGGVEVEGAQASLQEAQPTAHFRVADPGYFRTMAIPILKGRIFDERDRADSPLVVVVDRALEDRLWPEGTALGARIRYLDDRWAEIVGVVGSVQQETPGRPGLFEGMIYAPFPQRPFSAMSFVVRAAGARESTTKEVVRAWRETDNELPIDVQLMTEYVRGSRVPLRSPTALLISFAALACLMSAVGLYGLLSFAAHKEKPEIGIRMACGAAPSQVVREFVARSLFLVSLGLLTGVVLSLILVQWVVRAEVQKLLFAVSPFDPLVFGSAAALFLVVGLLAALIPARRASATDPAVALRMG